MKHLFYSMIVLGLGCTEIIVNPDFDAGPGTLDSSPLLDTGAPLMDAMALDGLMSVDAWGVPEDASGGRDAGPHIPSVVCVDQESNAALAVVFCDNFDRLRATSGCADEPQDVAVCPYAPWLSCRRCASALFNECWITLNIAVERFPDSCEEFQRKIDDGCDLDACGWIE